MMLSVLGLPRWCSGKEPPCQCKRHKRYGSIPGVRKIPWSRKWQPTRYSFLENSMDRGIWWAKVHGITKSQTKYTHVLDVEQ